MSDHVDRSADFPFAGSRAAELLLAGLEATTARRGVSRRSLAAELGYKQSVLLSHWASGRVPIPVERATELANALGIDDRLMLLAVLQQRHPTVDWEVLEDSQTPAYTFVNDIQTIAGGPIEELGQGQLRVMREAAADPRAERRWLSVHELPVVEYIRRARPVVREAGLSPTDQRRLERVFS